MLGGIIGYFFLGVYLKTKPSFSSLPGEKWGSQQIKLFGLDHLNREADSYVSGTAQVTALHVFDVVPDEGFQRWSVQGNPGAEKINASHTVLPSQHFDAPKFKVAWGKIFCIFAKFVNP